MPVIITTLVALGVHAAAVIVKKIRRMPPAASQEGDHAPAPVGARRPRRLSRRSAA